MDDDIGGVFLGHPLPLPVEDSDNSGGLVGRQLLAEPGEPRPAPLLGEVFELLHLAGRRVGQRPQIGEGGIERRRSLGSMKGVVGLGVGAFALQVFDGSRGRREGEMARGLEARDGEREVGREGERTKSPKRERSRCAHGKGRRERGVRRREGEEG